MQKIAKCCLLISISRKFLLLHHAFHKLKHLRKLSWIILRTMVFTGAFLFLYLYTSIHLLFPHFILCICPFFLMPGNFICLPRKTHIINLVFNSGYHWYPQMFGRKMFSIAISTTEEVPFFRNAY